jgi:hypothetical protein
MAEPNGEMIIYRGLPGSGKNFDIERRFTSGEWEGGGTVVCCTDDYWIQKYGEYCFKREEASQAHGWCFRAAIDCVLKRLQEPDYADRLVINNTNVRQAEYTPYSMIANAYDLSLRIIEVHCDLETALARNVHGVPKEVMEYMARSWENVLPWHKGVVERVDS